MNKSNDNSRVDYNEGYDRGVSDSLDNARLHAYYMGVGYAKSESGDDYLGFNTKDERESFKAGMANKDKHYNAHSYKRPGFFSRLFTLLRFDGLKAKHERNNNASKKPKRVSKSQRSGKGSTGLKKKLKTFKTSFKPSRPRYQKRGSRKNKY